jgi:hypothetical protein
VQLSAREAAQRHTVRERQLARDRLDLGDLLRGENGAVDPRAVYPPTRPVDPRRIFAATCSPRQRGNPAAPQYRCPASPPPHTESSARAEPPATTASASPPLKLHTLIPIKLDHITARAAHTHQFAKPHQPPSHNPTRFRPRLLARTPGLRDPRPVHSPASTRRQVRPLPTAARSVAIWPAG